ncbi:protein ASPARTIC PROTEASE IN GUARD CELL 1-like [Hordeum vulgare subsp. vulgare]|uniref:Predicted protein n=1 Tax=Hordeum vulgare subsp. vulgare TaxID=112509 RepID=F2EJ27_HORVV|nr:protein ASPARTIC PROTEASE IN GUARD CELL 1-like [Hordeum vulgare subsp. vulgare]BAK07349.1 predicted protein [Hordeum vulgare subsp. vulgare]
MSILYAYKLIFLFALLISASHGIVGNIAPPSAGFSLPIVSNHDTAGGLGANLTSIGPHIAPVGWPLYGVLVGVGSGQTRHFYKLGLDLVGNLTWIQCQPCVPEVRQEGAVFKSAVSPRYKDTKATDPKCTPPYTPSVGNRCSFYTTSWNVAAHGYLGSDMFGFAGSPGTGGHGTDVDKLTFGCAHTTDGFERLNHGVLAGALSLSRHPTSFLSQLTARRLADSRFSYCLFPGQSHPNARHGFLRFGRDIPRHDHAHSTSLLFTGRGSGSMYYIGVTSISLNGKRIIGLQPAFFRRNPQTRRGGSVVDPGTPLTRLVREAYNIVEAELVAYMQTQGSRRAPAPVQGHRLCFVSWGHAHLPSMTINMNEDRAKLFIKPELLFLKVTHEHLCFLVVPDEEMTVLGAAQQVDTRFTFDLHANRLYFAQEHCTADTRATV